MSHRRDPPEASGRRGPPAPTPFPERAGSAAALLGFLQMMTGLAVNALTSVLFDGTPRPMVTLNALCAVLALIAWWTLVRRQGLNRRRSV